MTRRGHPYTGARFRKALRFFLFGRAAQALASVAALLLAVRILPADEFGAYMVLIGIVEVCRPLSSLGLLPTVQQYLPEMALHATRGQFDRFVRWVTAARFAALALFSLVLYTWWVPITGWLGFASASQKDAWVACVLIVTLLGAAFTDQMLEALLEQRFAQVVRALLPIGRLAGLLGLVAFDAVSLLNVLWVDIVVSAVCLALAELALVRQLRQLQPDGSRTFEARQILSFAWHLSGSQVLNAAASGGALRIIVSAALGLAAAGEFGFMQQLLRQVQRFLPSLMFIGLVRPMLIAANVGGDRERLRAAAGLLRKSNLLLSAPLVGVVFLAGDTLPALLSGGKFADAGLTLTLILLAAVSGAQTQVTGTILQVLRHPRLVLILSMLALLSPLLVWGGCWQGLVGAAGGLALASWIRSATTLAVLHRREPWLGVDRSGILRCLAAVAFSLALAWTVGRYSWAASIAVFLLLYFGSLLVFRPLAPSDVALLATVAPTSHKSGLTRLLSRFGRAPTVVEISADRRPDV